VKNCEKLLLLTATPYVNSPYDFKSLIQLLYQSESIISKSGLSLPKTSKEYGSSNYVRGLDTIKKLLKNKVSYFNDKDETLYPKIIMKPIKIQMTNDYYVKYRVALVQDRQYGDRPDLFFHGYRRAVNKVGIEDYINEKIGAVLDILDDDKKAVIFTNWLEAGVEILQTILDEHNITYEVISGQITPSKRLDIVEEYNRNDELSVLIITTAGSEGLDLKGVRNMIILDPVWNPATMEQIIGRAVRFRSHIHLPEEERNVTVYPIILASSEAGTIPSGDEILYEIIEKKRMALEDITELLKEISI